VKKRDIELLNKVGKYYLQYKGVVDIEKLLSLFEGTTELPVNDYTLSYIYFYVIYLVTKDAVRSASEALEDRLTYREFSVEYSQELLGELDIPRTIEVYSMNMVAYYNFTEGLNAPEYSILGYLLRRIYYIVRKKLEGLKYDSNYKMPKYFNFYEDFKKKYEELNDLKEKFPDGYYREPSYTDPEWLKRAYRAYFLLKGLESVKVGTKEKGKGVVSDKKIIKFLFWKLYELYVFYLVVDYLESNGYHIIRKDGEFLAKKGDKYIRLVFNTSLTTSSLRKVDNMKDVEKYKGRPDISIDKLPKPIIFECKYSSSVSYITMGRFKVMAYTYEYDPEVAVLVYPGLKESQVDYDAEDSATRELDRMTKEKGFLLDFYYNSHLIYMAIIDPLREDKENLQVIDKILRKII
jgi:hypothetical protein